MNRIEEALIENLGRKEFEIVVRKPTLYLITGMDLFEATKTTSRSDCFYNKGEILSKV
jgi:hypothetical protein